MMRLKTNVVAAWCVAAACCAAPSLAAVKTGAAAGANAPAKPDAPAHPAAGGRHVDPGQAAVTQAVAALLKEWADYQKKPESAKLRTDPTYFTDNPSTDVTPEAVLNGMEKPIPANASAQSYVRWQLLSGVQGKFDDKLTGRVLRLYYNAPQPLAHPGFGRADLDQILFRLDKTPPAVEQANKQFSAAIERVKAANDVVLRYRDELYTRLPATGEAIEAGLRDVANRVRVGADAQTLQAQVSAAIQSWSAAGAKPAQMMAVAGTISALKDYADDHSHRPYEKIAIKSNGDLEWREAPAANIEQLVGEGKLLVNAADNPSEAKATFKKDK